VTRLACTCLLCAVVLALLPPAPAGAADPVPALSDAAAYPQQAESCGVIIRAMPGVAPAAIALAQQRLALLLEHLPQVQDNLRRAGAELRIVSDAAPASITGGVISYAQEANILKRSDDPFADHRDIVVHECSHMLHLCGFSRVDHQR
jgi:hypothetical protein